MGYWLGIDVGSTFTAAAVCRSAEATPEVVTLADHAAAVPSVVYLGEGGQVVVGEAAQRRALTDPDRVVRGFKQRIGDDVPMVIGGVAHTAPQIAAMVVRWVIAQVAAREGGPATGIVLTHPAGWGGYKIEVLVQALEAAGVAEVRLCSEPEAAAAGYAAAQRVEPGRTIAVYDLGGGTFDTAVVRTTAAGGFSVLGQPHGLEALGGVDFDDAVFGHVLAAVPALAELDAEDPATLAATAALRRECTQAKEALSADTEVMIPVLAPGISTQVRLHRAEFEDLIRPHITDTIHALRATLRSAQLDPTGIDAVLLVGGSSRIPLVTQLLSADLNRPVTIDTDPTTAIALGAARLALAATSVSQPAHDPPPAPAAPAPPGTAQPVASQPGASQPGASQPGASQPGPPSLTAIPLNVEPAELQWRRARSRRAKQFALAGALALVTAGGVAAVPFLTAHSDASAPASPANPLDAPASGTPEPGPPDPTTPGNGGANPPAGAGASGNASPRRALSGPARAPHPVTPGSSRNPDPAPVPTATPTPTWATTYTWTTSWSNPPPTTTTHSPTPPTATPAPITTTPPQPPPTTKESPPPTTATTAPPPPTSPPHHRRPTT